jgi:hypothetical protein
MTPDMLQLSEAHNKEGYLQSKLPLTTINLIQEEIKRRLNPGNSNKPELAPITVALSCHICLNQLQSP